MRNSRYKPFYKQWLLDNNVDIIIDGRSTRYVPTNKLDRNYKTAVVRQIKKSGKWKDCSICPNTRPHPKGLLKECTYIVCNIGYWDENKRWRSTGIPLHRIIYAWFNDVILPYNENDELMDICHNNRQRDDNHINNLRWDTRAHNLAEREGFINQWGPRKKAKKDEN